MLAAVFDAIGKPLRIDRMPDPVARAGELVLRVGACGICGSDLHAASYADGVFGDPLPAGTILGHEFAGEVVEVGAGGKERWRVGDRAAGFPILSCGRCAACRSQRPADCRSARFMGLSGAAGAYAEYAVADAHHSVPLSRYVDDPRAALAEPLAVCLHAASLGMPLRSARVLIIGAGPIGLLLVAACRHNGARSIVVSDIAPERLSRAPTMGADGVVDASRGHADETIRDLAKGRPDVVFDAAGDESTLDFACAIAARGARIVVVAPGAKPVLLNAMTGFYKELTICFSKAYSTGDFREACRMIEDGAIDVRPAISSVVGFAAFPALFDSLLRPNSHGKVLLAPFN